MAANGVRLAVLLLFALDEMPVFPFMVGAV